MGNFFTGICRQAVAAYNNHGLINYKQNNSGLPYEIEIFLVNEYLYYISNNHPSLILGRRTDIPQERQTILENVQMAFAESDGSL